VSRERRSQARCEIVLKLIVKFIGGEGEALQEEAVGSGHMGWKPLYLFQRLL
jgi:hypothetical protein